MQVVILAVFACCVGGYISRVASGKTDVVYIRKVAEINKSLGTMEICDGRIKQARGKYNQDLPKEVQDFVMQYQESHDFLDKLQDMVEFLIPNYISEGKNQLVISIGCTGGKHRSVTLANELYNRLKENSGYGIKIEHRDIGKDALRGK